MGDILGNILSPSSGEVPPGSISNLELAVMPLRTIKGNQTASTTNPQDLTVDETLALIGLSEFDIVQFTGLNLNTASPNAVADIHGSLNIFLSNFTTSSGAGNRDIACVAHTLNVGDAVGLRSGPASAIEVFTVATVTDVDNFTVDTDLTNAIVSVPGLKDSDLFNLSTNDGNSRFNVDKSGNITGQAIALASNLTFIAGGEPLGLPGTPSVGNAGASKDYVDSVAQGLSWQSPVLDKDLATPPGSPITGDRYIVASGGTGDWSSHDDDITTWNGSIWIFVTPSEGFANWVEDEDTNYVFTTSWVKLGSTVDHGNLLGLSDDDHSQYHTDARAVTWLGTRSTDDLPEGSDLYYTESRVSANTDVASNTADRHTHANKTELDLIVDAGSGDIITDTERTNFTTAFNERAEWDGGATNLVPLDGRNSLELGITDDVELLRLTLGLKSTADFHVGETTGAEASDQSQLVDIFGTSTSDAWQSFTPGVNGLLTAFSFAVGGAVTRTFNIYEGEGNGGTLLLSMPSTAFISGTTKVILSIPVVLEAGKLYTAEIVGSVFPRYSNTSLYPDGRASIASFNDMVFESFMTPIDTFVIVNSAINKFMGLNITNPQEQLDVGGNIQATSGVYKVDGTQVVNTRVTGWGAPTGTPTRTTFDTTTVTLEQLAERLKALIDDLTTHGLIGV